MKWMFVPCTVALLTGCGSEQNLFEQKRTDNWEQAGNNQVDVLFVIDDSASMAQEQDVLIAGFSSFAGRLEASGTDFHLGVITTSFDYDSPDRGVLIGDPPFLTAEDDYEAAFVERATVGILGSDKEKGLEAAAFALHPLMNLPGGRNEGFVRANAKLLIVFVSDEEDCSDKGVLEGQPPSDCYLQSQLLPPVTEYITELRELKDRPDLVQVGAIVATEDSACDNVFPGQRYITTALLTGGLVGDICQSDWSGILGELGLNASGVLTSFQLSAAAVPDTLTVYVDEDEVVEDALQRWTYDPQTWFITFSDDAVPARGSVIAASYTIQSGVPSPPGEASVGGD